jgi:hypothetical protein
MIYQIHSFTGYDVSIAKMITELCEANDMRVHTAWYEQPSGKRGESRHGTVRVLFEKIERMQGWRG